jgi:sortase A
VSTLRARAAAPIIHRHGAAIAVVLAVAFAAIATTWVGAATIPDPGWVVSATSPTTGLADGQRVAINIKSRSDVAVTELVVQECRLGVRYATPDDASSGSGNCPPTPISSSSTGILVRGSFNGIIPAIQAPDGATFFYKVGTGVADWTGKNGPARLTCDETTDCALVVQLRVGGQYVFSVIPLKFGTSDPIAGCGGAAKGIVATAAGDRISDAWASWTRQFCASSAPGTGAPTRITFPGEGTAVDQFSTRDPKDGYTIDLAYTSLGYDKQVGFLSAENSPRNVVAIPIALDAAVIGVGGGATRPPGVKFPYDNIELKSSEIATLFGSGLLTLTRPDLPYAAAIRARNPQLNGLLQFVDGNVTSTPLAPSTADGVSWLTTRYLSALSPNDFVTRRTDPPTRRGTDAALATANPPYQPADVGLYTGKPVVSKTLDIAELSLQDGPVWVMTDLASANALGMTQVAIENSAGQFVAPTAASLTAAVAVMQPNENGLLVSSPTMTAASTTGVAAADVVQPYPLTFVEYALVPLEPLVNENGCTLRSSSQQLMGQWLDYLIGPGQQNLPAGYVPLPPTLLAQATAQVKKVGTAPVTGKCAGTVTVSANAVPPAGSFGSAPPSPSSFSGLGSSLPSSIASSNAGTSSTSNVKDIAAEAAVAIPGYVTGRSANDLAIVLAMLGIVVVTSLGAFMTSQRTLPVSGAGAGATRFGERGAAQPGIAGLVVLWVTVAALGVAVVVYQLGPLLAARDQHELLTSYRHEIHQAAVATQGLQGATEPDKAPERGAAVGILEIGALRIQNVVVEGAQPSQTSEGPGHVPGTAGLGQPGNSVVVARRNGFGGAFAQLGDLRRGQRMLVTTTQGQSVYKVASVSNRTIGDSGAAESSSCSDSTSSAPATTTTSPTASTTSSTTTTRAPSGTKAATSASTAYAAPGATTTDGAGAKTICSQTLYGPSKDDRLTLLTSSTRAPWNSSDATIVVAKLQGKPFTPTLQNGLSDSETGRNVDGGAWAPVVLSLMLYAGAVVASVAIYRRFHFRVAYLLTIAPLVALTLLAGEAVSRLLPAWT